MTYAERREVTFFDVGIRAPNNAASIEKIRRFIKTAVF